MSELAPNNNGNIEFEPVRGRPASTGTVVVVATTVVPKRRIVSVVVVGVVTGTVVVAAIVVPCTWVLVVDCAVVVADTWVVVVVGTVAVVVATTGATDVVVAVPQTNVKDSWACCGPRYVQVTSTSMCAGVAASVAVAAEISSCASVIVLVTSTSLLTVCPFTSAAMRTVTPLSGKSLKCAVT